MNLLNNTLSWEQLDNTDGPVASVVMPSDEMKGNAGEAIDFFYDDRMG